MFTFVVVIHLIVCFVLIAIVMLQSGKGAEMGAAFGGSSQTIFGSRGATTFLSKVTIGAAVLFFVTSMTLSIMGRERSVVSRVVIPSPIEEVETTEESAPSAGEPEEK
ncbi:MAG: preprotein translocase subunit SecG [Nitrospira sp.]|nr:preprotein translocase subunit SecG [Candidatus Manganitrophaceae bacterium]HIL34133.1 preprotein translocase subunit SecG [Candidatus Manganitrophaceae bacterium]